MDCVKLTCLQIEKVLDSVTRIRILCNDLNFVMNGYDFLFFDSLFRNLNVIEQAVSSTLVESRSDNGE